MGWAVGYDRNWKRDIGYGVPSKCDHPDCDTDIDRGLAYVCGGEPYGGEHGCGLYFCADHMTFVETRDGGAPQVCERCAQRHARPDADEPELFEAKPDVAQWIAWKLSDASWGPWRVEYPAELERLKEQARQAGIKGNVYGRVLPIDQQQSVGSSSCVDCGHPHWDTIKLRFVRCGVCSCVLVGRNEIEL